MANLCLTSCGQSNSNPPVSFYDPCATYSRDAGIQHLIYFPCDYQWTNILDPVEWAAMKTAGQVQLSPKSKFTKSVTAGASYETDDCGGVEQENDVWNMAVETYYADPDLADASYHRELVARKDSLHFIWVTCSGDFYVNDEWFVEILDKTVNGGAATVSGSTPGFKVGFSEKPTESPSTNNAKKSSWKYTLQWETASDHYPVKLPGVLAAIAA